MSSSEGTVPVRRSTRSAAWKNAALLITKSSVLQRSASRNAAHDLTIESLAPQGTRSTSLTSLSKGGGTGAIDRLENENAALKNENAALKNENAALKKSMAAAEKAQMEVRNAEEKKQLLASAAGFRTKPLKIVLCGDDGVGKTALAKKLSQNVLNANDIATIGPKTHPLNFMSNRGPLAVEVTVVSGKCMPWREIKGKLPEDAEAAIIMFDLCSPTTMDHARVQWLGPIRAKFKDDVRFAEHKFPIVVVGNKEDHDNVKITKDHMDARFEHQRYDGIVKMTMKDVNVADIKSILKPFEEVAKTITGISDLKIESIIGN